MISKKLNFFSIIGPLLTKTKCLSNETFLRDQKEKQRERSNLLRIDNDKCPMIESNDRTYPFDLSIKQQPIIDLDRLNFREEKKKNECFPFVITFAKRLKRLKKRIEKRENR